MTAPLLIIELELEGTPSAHVLCATLEDEMRLRTWATNPLVRRRLIRAIEDALDQLVHERREAA